MREIFENLTDEEVDALAALLMSTTVQNEIGAENWTLTEEQEDTLWPLIHRIEGTAGVVHPEPTVVPMRSIEDVIAQIGKSFGKED